MNIQELQTVVRLLFQLDEQHPDASRYIRAKILEPDLSLRQLGGRFGVSRETIFRKMLAAVTDFPVFGTVCRFSQPGRTPQQTRIQRAARRINPADRK